ncbi:hypothetical protein A311_00215 [Escherichia coli KTE146]|nr:hypothetical protein A311_00215 [Escherichia coli KTE146]
MFCIRINTRDKMQPTNCVEVVALKYEPTLFLMH